MRRKNSIGTSVAAIDAAAQALGRPLPPSHAAWLLANNGRALGALTLFPVYDADNPRKTWESIDRHYRTDWQEWLEHTGSDGGSLLPFAQFGTGDYYCFDYARGGPAGEAAGEPPVVLWSHETGAATAVAADFTAFLALPGRPG